MSQVEDEDRHLDNEANHSTIELKLKICELMQWMHDRQVLTVLTVFLLHSRMRVAQTAEYRFELDVTIL